MSMISEFVKELREKSALFSKSDFAVAGIANDYKEAADIIEELSAKLARANKERSKQYYKDVPDTNVGKWIPVSDHYPDTEKYILLSFSNFSIPVVGRWEEDENGGSFYVGDEQDSCVSQDLYVNAWQPLPQPYKGE